MEDENDPFALSRQAMKKAKINLEADPRHIEKNKKNLNLEKI